MERDAAAQCRHAQRRAHAAGRTHRAEKALSLGTKKVPLKVVVPYTEDRPVEFRPCRNRVRSVLRACECTG